MIRCNGWHEPRQYPKAVYVSANVFGGLCACETCKAQWTHHHDVAIIWRPIRTIEHVRAALARPFWALDRLTGYRFRPKQVQILTVIAFRIYDGKNLFAPIFRRAA